jgi:hypothetical protein
VIFVLFAGRLGSLKSSLKEADGEFVKVLAGFSLSLSLSLCFFFFLPVFGGENPQ